MSITGINSSTLLSALLQQQQQGQSTTQQTTATQSTSTTQANDTAYTMALGQEKAKSSLQGYSSLGKLINQADAALAAMDTTNPNISAQQGNGATLQKKYTINVSQLALPQTVTSQSYSSANQSVVTPGTLTLQSGSYSPVDGNFTASGKLVNVSVTNGSLSGIASAINAAQTGIAASVIKATDGSSQLQLIGPTGASNAFQLGGIAASLSVEETQSAGDALFSVNGGATQSSPTNSGASIGDGATADFTATGVMTVQVPFGLSQANGAAQTLVSNVNTLLSGLSSMTSKNGALADDAGVATSLTKAINTALAQNSLASIGITTQSDGTLNISESALQEAYISDPSGTRALLDKAGAAIQKVLEGSSGATGQISSHLHTLSSSLAQTTSLLDYLNGTADSNSNSSQQSLLSLLSGNNSGSDLLSILDQSNKSSQSSQSSQSNWSSLTGQSSQTTSLQAALDSLTNSSDPNDISNSISSLLSALQGTSSMS